MSEYASCGHSWGAHDDGCAACGIEAAQHLRSLLSEAVEALRASAREHGHGNCLACKRARAVAARITRAMGEVVP